MKPLIAWCLGANARATRPLPHMAGGNKAPAPEPIDLEAIPRYPPFAKGLPLATVAQLLESQSELIRRLEQELALGRDDDGTARWSTYIEPVIRRYAAFVHLIPASEAHHHCGSGGLLRHGLEVAFRAARLSRGVLVARDRPREQQLQIEPRFVAAAALAGLLHDAGKAVADVTATDRDGRMIWNPHQGDLVAWARRRRLARYFLHWRAGRAGAHEGFNLVALRLVLPSAVDAWLSSPDPRVYVGFLSAVTGMPHPSALVELVRKADRASVEQDLKENRIAPLETAVGVPIERYLIDGMRRLVHEGRWTVNVPGARVWLLRDGGLHLVWPAAARDLAVQLAEDRLPGIPRDPDTLAELLIERGLVVVQEEVDASRPTWRLAPAPLQRPDGSAVWLHLLRLSDPGLLFPFGAPPPVDALGIKDAAALIESSTADVAVETTAAETLAGAAAETLRTNTPVPDAPDRRDAPARDAIATQAPQAGHPTPETPSAEIRLRSLLTQSADLLEHLDPLAAAEGGTVMHRHGLYWLRYPDWFAAVGWSPAAAAEALSSDGVIEPDPATPMRRVRDHGGSRWIVLNSECSVALQARLDALPVTRAPGQPAVRPAPIRPAAVVPGAAPQAVPGEPPAAGERPSAVARASASAPPRVGVEALDRQVLERLILELRPAEGQPERPLSRTALQALARQRGFGVYRLREALLSDERVRAQGTQLLIRR